MTPRRVTLLTLAALLWVAGAYSTRHVDSDRPTNPPTPSTSVLLGEDSPTWTAPAPRVAPTAASRARTPGTDGLGRLNWAALRYCESSGNYRANTGNGYYGAYQFDLSTWRSVGGSGNPARASKAEQDRRARLLYAKRGAQPWPACGRWLR